MGSDAGVWVCDGRELVKLFSPEGTLAEKLQTFLESLMGSINVSTQTAEGPSKANARQLDDQLDGNWMINWIILPYFLDNGLHSSEGVASREPKDCGIVYI